MLNPFRKPRKAEATTNTPAHSYTPDLLAPARTTGQGTTQLHKPSAREGGGQSRGHTTQQSGQGRQPWLCHCRCLTPTSSSPFSPSCRHPSLHSTPPPRSCRRVPSYRPPPPLPPRLLAPAPPAHAIYIATRPPPASSSSIPTSPPPHSTCYRGRTAEQSHGEHLLRDPGEGAGRPERRGRAVLAAGAAASGGAAQGPALAAHGARRPAPPAARRPVARRVHGRDGAPLGRLPRRQARPRRRRALLRRRVLRRRRPRRLAPGPLPPLHPPGDEGDLGVEEGGHGRGGGEPGDVRVEDRAAVPAAGRAARGRRQAQRLQRLPRAALRAAQRQLPPAAHPRRRRRRRVAVLVRRRRGHQQQQQQRVHGVHRDAAEEDGGGGRGRRRAGDDQDAGAAARARGGGGGAGGGGARGGGRRQVRRPRRRREGQGRGAEGVVGGAPRRHRRAGVPAGRLPGRHCGGPQGALRPLQPLKTGPIERPTPNSMDEMMVVPVAWLRLLASPCLAWWWWRWCTSKAMLLRSISGSST